MNRHRHRYGYWGIGHMSHPEDPQGCCDESADARVHQCEDCPLPFGHDGKCA